MIPELGHFALITALAVAIVQSFVPLLGAWRGVPEWMALAVPATRAQFLFVLLAYACLTYAFVSKDFSVAYVARTHISGRSKKIRVYVTEMSFVRKNQFLGGRSFFLSPPCM